MSAPDTPTTSAAYKPHRWHWLNGFWAECSCGHIDSGYSMTLLRRRMDKHVREATGNDLAAAKIEAMKSA